MADDPKKRKQDAKLVAAQQTYELGYFAKKHGITKEQAAAIIKKAGNSRAKANKLAEGH